MGLRNVSASQVTTFARCNRWWHWEKIGGHRQSSTRAMRRGTAIHYALEIYLSQGRIVGGVEVDIETGNATHNTTDVKSPEPDKNRTTGGEWWATKRYVEAIRHLLPTPERDGGPAVMLEQAFSIPTLGGKGPPWLGFIDLLEECVTIEPYEDDEAEFLPPPLAFVLSRVNDYKTSSDLRRYAKKNTELLDDIQANSYAKYVFNLDPEAEEVAARWIYMETRNKVKVNILEVPVVLTRSGVEANWARAMELVQKMVELAEVEDTLALDANPEACGDFGGCPHVRRCGLSALGGAFTKLNNNTKQKGKSMGFLKGLKRTMDRAEDATGVLSDDAGSRTTSDEEAKELTPKKKPAKKTAAEKKAEKEAKVAAAKKAKAAAKAAEAAEAAAKAAEEAEAGEDDTEEPPKKKPAKASKKAPKAKAGGFTLYVDCVPTKGEEYALLSDLLVPLVEECGGLEEFWDLSFSDQKKALGIMAREIAKGGNNVVAFSKQMFSADVVPGLSVVAAKVIMGMKG